MRNTSFCKDIYRKDKHGKTWRSHSHPERTQRGWNCSVSFDHFEALDKWINFSALLFHNPQENTNTTHLKISLRYKWHRKHLSPFLDHSPSRVSFLWLFLTGQFIVFLLAQSPRWWIGNFSNSSHTAFLKFKFLLVIEQKIPPWWSPNWTLLLLILYYIALRAYPFCFMGMHKCLHVSCFFFFFAFHDIL